MPRLEQFLTPEEREVEVGLQLKHLRLFKNLEQSTVAERAGVSVKALRNLENGRGSTLRTLIEVVRALGRTDWFDTIAPIPSINPLSLVVTGSEVHVRKRASRTRVAKNKSAKPSSQGETTEQSDHRKPRGFRIEY